MTEVLTTTNTSTATEPIYEQVPDDVNALLEQAKEAARAEEKKKLYARLKREEERASLAEQQAADIASQLEDLKKFKKQIELDKLGDIEKLQAQLQLAEAKATEETQLRLQKEMELRESLRLMELSRFRDQLIKESELDPDLQDLVKGDTEDLLRESVEKAKQREARLKEKYTQTVAPQPTPAPPTPPSPTAPASPYPNLLPDAFNPHEVKTRADLEERKRRLGLK